MDRYLETYRKTISLRGLTSHALKGYYRIESTETETKNHLSL